MFIIHVHIQVKPGFEDAFIAATLNNAKNSVNEPGVIRFDFLRNTSDPLRFTLVEVYREEADLARHKETAHYAAWVATATDLIEPRTRTFYENLFPTETYTGKGAW